MSTSADAFLTRSIDRKQGLCAGQAGSSPLASSSVLQTHIGGRAIPEITPLTGNGFIDSNPLRKWTRSSTLEHYTGDMSNSNIMIENKNVGPIHPSTICV